MATVRGFDRSMIRTFLDDKDIHFLIDRDGDFQVVFSDNGERGCEITFWLIAGGSNAQIYNIMAWSDKRIPRSDWGQALLLCNTWNKEKRWPRAYLWASDPASDTTGSIRLDMQLDLEPGIHQELLDDFSLTVMAGVLNFWEWAHKEQGF